MKVYKPKALHVELFEFLFMNTVLIHIKCSSKHASIQQVAYYNNYHYNYITDYGIFES